MILLASALLIAGCTPEQVTKTVNLTNTATVTLPPETIVTTATKTVTLLPEPSIPNQITEGITATEAFNMIQANLNNPEFVIIDVRTPEERSVSYIEGSILLDWSGGVFAAEIGSLDRCKTYLLY
jgi:hypothetical protein